MAIAIPLPARRRPITRRLPAMLALVPAALAVIVVYLGCMLWTVRLSFTSSKLLPTLDFVGFEQYARLFSNARFLVSIQNIVVFGALFLIGCLVLGFLLAVFIDQRVRAEGAFRTIYPLPARHVVHRHRPGLAVVPQPDARPAEAGARRRLAELHLRLARQPGDGDLHAGASPGIWQSAGLIMAILLAGPARRRRGSLEGGAGRRHPDLAGLFLDRAADAAADADHRRPSCSRSRWSRSTTSWSR